MAYSKVIQRVIDLFTRTDNLQSAIDALSASLLDKIYPVGSVYMSFTNKSPAELLGGTWEALADGRVLIAANSTYAVNTTGGATTHTLTAGEMPSHNHGATTANGGHSHNRGSMNITGFAHTGDRRTHWVTSGCFYVYQPGEEEWGAQSGVFGNNQGLAFDASRNWTGATNTVANHQHDTQNVGSGESHNNMQPYRAVYMWKRTA